jgi:hypothetical protein
LFLRYPLSREKINAVFSVVVKTGERKLSSPCPEDYRLKFVDADEGIEIILAAQF